MPDLREADLSERQLRYAYFRGVHFRGANLSGADLRAVDLRMADLRATNFRGTNLMGADLRWAVLIAADLSEADLRFAELRGVDLREAKLIGAALAVADLHRANLAGRDLGQADLYGADLSEATLWGANLRRADLREANLSGADLCYADLSGAHLDGVDLDRARLWHTIFGAVDLTRTNGLNECDHIGPSIIDFETLFLFKNLPISFLRGCGVPNIIIDYLPSLREDAIQYYSCFISYSTMDQLFADRLHADLQNKGVRCWFAPHDLPIGAKTWDAIDEAIRVRDKLLLILSEASIASEWVEDEVNKAYAEERSRKETVLFPIRIDNAVMSTGEPWAVKLRDQRNIGDFRRWKTPAEYQKSLDRLLRDLKATGAK
jgi:uncharacterized protein YjbI with pentapeptide repeats